MEVLPRGIRTSAHLGTLTIVHSKTLELRVRQLLHDRYPFHHLSTWKLTERHVEAADSNTSQDHTLLSPGVLNPFPLARILFQPQSIITDVQNMGKVAVNTFTGCGTTYSGF